MNLQPNDKNYSYNIVYTGKGKSDNWEFFRWAVTINSECFEYRTGMGHALKLVNKNGHKVMPKKQPGKKYTVDGVDLIEIPDIDQILNCLFLDGHAVDMSFYNFCDDYGYSRDSIKAFQTYQACCDNGERLKKALGSLYRDEKERIEKLEL